jgi:hypothetical protein
MSHNSDENMGVDTKYRRLKIVSNNKTIDIPIYSGNAFRGILRRVAAKQFLDLLGVEKVKDALYYTLFCGGSLQKGSAQDNIDVGKKRELRKNIPFLSLFGSAVINQIFSGKLQIGICVPITKETSGITGVESTLSIWETLTEIFYTRRDDLEDKELPRGEGTAQQMKYTVECLIPNLELYQKISVQAATEIELSCLGYAMEGLMKKGVLGGKSGVGHGQCLFSYTPGFDTGDRYLEYVSQNKEGIVSFLKTLEESL